MLLQLIHSYGIRLGCETFIDLQWTILSAPKYAAFFFFLHSQYKHTLCIHALKNINLLVQICLT